MKIKEKQLARKLRKQGLAITTISEQLHVAKSSVSLWVRDIELTKKQHRAIDRSPGRIAASLAWSESHALLRKKWRKEGTSLAKANENFRVLSALYWCEGHKLNNRNVFSISNCDPDMLSKVLKLTKEFSSKQPSLEIHAFTNNNLTLKQISNWWKQTLKLKEAPYIYEAKPSKWSKKKNHGKQLYGTVQIRIHSTELLQKVLGGIEFLKS